MTVGALAADCVFELFVGNEATLLEVDQEHLAWLQAAFEQNIGGVYVHHADLRRHDDLVVFGDVVAARTQTVPV